MTHPSAVTAFGLHHRGNVREEDQDFLLYWGDPGVDPRPVDLRECLDPCAGSRFLSPARFFVLADGMGGLAEGASAARTACHTAFAAFRTLALGFNLEVSAHLGGVRPDSDPAWQDAGLPHLTTGLAGRAQELLLQAVEAANEPVWREGQGRWGSTLLAAAVCDNHVLLATAGDCRAYLLAPGGRFDLVTRDDNLAWEAIASGRLSYEEAVEEGLASRLTRYIGMGPRVNPTGYALDLSAGGRLLLCTDGLYGSFDGERLMARLAGTPALDEAVERLMAGALARGGHDNVSALIVDIPAGQGPPAGTLLPPTPVLRRSPGLRGWLRERRRRAAAERLGTKAALALVLAVGLAAGLWVGAGSLPLSGDAAASGRSEPHLETPPVLAPPSPSGQAAFGSPAGSVPSCDPRPGQVCPGPGETLESLALRLGLDLRSLAALNQNISPGVELRQDVPLWVPQPSRPSVPTPLPSIQ